MGLFDFFKKKDKENHDVLNLKVADLKVGWLLDFDMDTWEVKQVARYDWGNEVFSHEYKMVSGGKTRFLELDTEDGETLTWSKEISARKINGDVVDQILKEMPVNNQLVYQGETYTKEESCAGYYDNGNAKTADDWEPFVNWDFISDDGKKVISFTQWGEDEVEGAIGEIIENWKIENILPR